jgi:arylsulfatase A-like enzyme
MVAAMDEAIGKVMAAVDARGWRRNTLIFFSSDNGGPNPGVVTSNGPLRGGKATPYEGGTRVPAIVAWDGRLSKGGIVNEPLHMVDWYPTLLKLVGVSADQNLPVDGLDAWPTIVDGKPSPHDAILIQQSPEAGAVRVGNWKLVVNFPQPEGSPKRTAKVPKAKKKAANESASDELPPLELFDLAADPYEKTNLADAYPDRVQQLRQRYDAFAAQAVPPKLHPPTATYKPPKVWGEVD